MAVSGGTFPPGLGMIGLTNVDCDGSESNFSDCSSSSVSLNSTCIHQNDAGVVCAMPCSPGEVRIGDMSHVEVCNENNWVSICGVDWTLETGNTVCMNLDFSPKGIHYYTTSI